MHRNAARTYDGGKIAGLYDMEETLGRGHFAVVKLARHVFTGEKVAVKVIDKTKLDEVSRSHLFQEVRCMKLVQHPNVVRLYEVIDTHSKLYLILELADGGDLYDYIMRHESGLSESVAQQYFAQIVRAISYCHHLHVVHRDLKPENVVFFESDGVVKLTDFGFSNKFCPGQKLATSCGSLAYSAPEILLGDSYDAPAVDIWSLGVILYMLVCGQAPFQEANDSETLTMIMDCKYTVPSHISQDCQRLIARMLVRQPEKRATLEEIAADVWLKDAEKDNSATFPLVSRQHISEEDHSIIVQKMINGGIATKEQILEALDKNSYNHITATYFLLAERKLRAQAPKNTISIQKNAPKVNVVSCQGNNAAVFQTSHTLLGIPRPTLDIIQRTRKCSIVTEEEDEEEEHGSDGSLHNSLNRRGSRSEGKLNLAVQEIRKESLDRSSSGVGSCTSPCHSGKMSSSLSSPSSSSKMLPCPLITARSSPQLGLDEILEDGPAGSSGLRTTPNFEQRRSRFRKSRTGSCSSSETSDDDEQRKKRGSNASLRVLRRNPGGDSDGAGGGSTGGGGQLDGGGGGCSGEEGDGGEKIGEGKKDFGEKGGGELGKRGMIGGGRCRGIETRLRESRSLNRITEVSEPQQSPKVVARCGGGSGSGRMPALMEEERVKMGKRNALLGKCLSLQRKICGPFLTRKGRLYKTKSCNEVVHADGDLMQASNGVIITHTNNF